MVPDTCVPTWTVVTASSVPVASTVSTTSPRVTAAVVNCGRPVAPARPVVGGHRHGHGRDGNKDEHQSFLHVLIRRRRRGGASDAPVTFRWRPAGHAFCHNRVTAAPRFPAEMEAHVEYRARALHCVGTAADGQSATDRAPTVLVVEDETQHPRARRAPPEAREDRRRRRRPTARRRSSSRGRGKFDLIVLDLMLPGLDGVTLCRAIRRDSPNADTPILMLTARREESDKVLGPRQRRRRLPDQAVRRPRADGARARAAAARCRRARRRRGNGDHAPLAYKHIADRSGAPTRHASALATSSSPRNEFQLLHVLLSNPGIVFSREALLRRVWKDDTFVTVRSVDTLVKRLRKKIEEDPAEPAVILTVWGAGYKAPMSMTLRPHGASAGIASLYWRIALGLFAFLALMLAAQGALFLWMTDRIAGSMPARDPAPPRGPGRLRRRRRACRHSRARLAAVRAGSVRPRVPAVRRA